MNTQGPLWLGGLMCKSQIQLEMCANCYPHIESLSLQFKMARRQPLKKLTGSSIGN